MDFILTEQFQELGWVIGLAVLGGVNSFLHKYLRKDYCGTLSKTGFFFAFLHSVISSALAGMVGFWGCQEFNMSPHMTAIVVAMSGHMSSRWLNFTERLLTSKVSAVVGERE